MDYSDSLSELLNEASTTRSYLMYCENAQCSHSYTRFSAIWRRNYNFDWLIDLKCTSCEQQWSICSSCSNCKMRFKSGDQIKNHRAYWHSTKGKKRKQSIAKDEENMFTTTTNANIDGFAIHINAPNAKLVKRSSDTRTYPKSVNQGFPDSVNQGQIDGTTKIQTDPAHIHFDQSLKRFIHNKHNNEAQSVHKNPETSVTADEPDLVQLDALLDSTVMSHMNDKSKVFFGYDLSNNGKKYLVSLITNVSMSECIRSLKDEEVDFQILMSKFVNSLKRSQQREFCSVMKRMKDLYVVVPNELKNKPICIIPSKFCDLKRMYLEGGSAINKNLPIPNVQFENYHSTVSIVDCVISFLLSHNSDVTTLDKWNDVIQQTVPDIEDHYLLFNCQRIQNIIEDARNRVLYESCKKDEIVIPIFITLWSDDFDPNKSVKNNRQSVWVQTATLFIMDSNGYNVKSTFPIAMSKKGSDHDLVYKKIIKDLKVLNSGKFLKCYSKYLGRFVNVHADIFTVLADQPERRTMLRLSAGNSTVHTRFGTIMNCRQSVDYIRSCDTCTESINREVLHFSYGHNTGNVSYHWRKSTCTKCTSWLYHESNKLLYHIPEKEFPVKYVDEICDGVGKLSPKSIHQDSLNEAIDKITETIDKGTMKIAHAKCYLRYVGFNNETVDDIVECAVNCKKIRIAKENNEDKTEYTELLELKEQFPSKYSKYQLPSIFSLAKSLSMFVPVPMHLLMLGITKSVCLKIDKWLRDSKQKTAFLNLGEDLLQGIKDMNVEWCKILRYPTTDKFGGWISENFLAMNRVSLWFYSVIFAMPAVQPYKDPEIDISNYKAKDTRQWLSARGLPQEGKAKDLLNIIKNYYATNTVPDILVQETSIQSNDIFELLHSMALMNHVIMSPTSTKSDIHALPAIIRQFLIKYDKFDVKVNEHKDPSWIRQYNFMSLLDIPSTISIYGSMRNLWEGGIDGEGYLRYVKPELTSGLVNKWESWCITNLLHKKVYSDLLEHPNTKENFLIELRKECRVYRKLNTLKEDIQNKKALSGIIINNDNNTIYVCYRLKKTYLV